MKNSKRQRQNNTCGVSTQWRTGRKQRTGAPLQGEKTAPSGGEGEKGGTIPKGRTERQVKRTNHYVEGGVGRGGRRRHVGGYWSWPRKGGGKLKGRSDLGLGGGDLSRLAQDLDRLLVNRHKKHSSDIYRKKVL